MKVEVHDRLETVGAAAWEALHARTHLRSPFLTWTWQRDWVEALGGGRRLEVWGVSDDDGRLLALLPLHEAEPGLLQPVGGTDVSDYLDLIAADGREREAWDALLEARAGSRSVWELHAVPAASPTLAALAALAPARGLDVTVGVEERCPVLALPATWEAYLQSLTGKQRHELARKTRRLEREAPGSGATSVAAPEALAERLDEFLDLHRRSRTGKARFMDAMMEAFFRRAVASLAARGGARLWFLDTPEGPVASFITLEWDGTVGLYNSGFHPDRAALAPGIVLLGYLVRDAIERGMRRFDFLRGEERYKYDFGPVAEDVHLVRLAPA